MQNTTINKIKEIKQTFEIEYFTRNDKPILCFLYPNTEEKSELSKITPLYIEIPSFVARPAVEQLDLVISFLKKESERLQKKIKVSKSFIKTVIENSSNIDSLQQNIVYLVSRYFFDVQGKENEIILNYELVSNYLPKINNTETNLDLQNIPEVFTIEPFEKVKVVNSVSINDKHPTMKWVPNATQSFLYYLQNTSSIIIDEEVKKAKIHHAITKVFSKKSLSCDTFTKNKIINILFDIIYNKNDFSELFFNLPSVSGLTTQVISISENIEKGLSELNCKMSIKQSYRIKNSLSHAFFVFNEYTIPIVLISESSLIIQAIQTVFNVYYQNHCIYTYEIKKESIDKELDSLTKYIISIDKGKGVLLLTDKDMRAKIASHFFSNTKVSTYTIAYSSFPLIIESIKEFKKSNNTLLALTPELILQNSKIDKMLNNEKFTKYSIRATNEYMLKLKNIYPNINTYEMNENVFTLLKTLTEMLQIEMNNTMILNFIFHMNALINIKKLKLSSNLINTTSCVDEGFEMIMRQLIYKNEKFKKFNFSSGDFEYLRQTIYNS